jgi:hypothetical protein
MELRTERDEGQNSGNIAVGLIAPDQLKRITEEKDMEKAREALEKKAQGR